MFDRNNPATLISRSDDPIFSPHESWEIVGQVPNVVFVEGMVQQAKRYLFYYGGADANENAIRMARLHTGRDTVISGYRSYHGNTGAAVVATGDWRRIPNEYARGHVHVFTPYLYRSEFWASTP